MIEQKDDESRIEYLARVLHEFMTTSIAGEITIFYDGTECDGRCLANDFLSELDMDERELLRTVG